MIKNPCMGCPKIGCGIYHDICPDYQLYREEKVKEYKKRRELYDHNYDLRENSKRHFKAAEKFRSKP